MSCLASSCNCVLCCSTICDVSDSACDATSLPLLDQLLVYRSTELILGILCGPNMSLGVLSTKVYLPFLSLAQNHRVTTLTLTWIWRNPTIVDAEALPNYLTVISMPLGHGGIVTQVLLNLEK